MTSRNIVKLNAFAAMICTLGAVITILCGQRGWMILCAVLAVANAYCAWTESRR